MTTDYPNHHLVCPFYRLSPLEEGPAWFFIDAIAASHAALNARIAARRDAAYESELVPLSSGSSVKIPQFLLPLGSKPAARQHFGEFASLNLPLDKLSALG